MGMMPKPARDLARDLVVAAPALTDLAPQFAAPEYAHVRALDAARMQLGDAYDVTDGEYLRRIRAALQADQGKRTRLWKAYLNARGIPYQTALNRIWKAENHVVTPRDTTRDNTNLVLSAAPQPAPSYDDEPDGVFWLDAGDAGDAGNVDDDWPPRDMSRDDLDTPDAPDASPESVPSVTTYAIETWEDLHPDVRLAVIAEGRAGKAGLDRQDATNIEWAQWSWNPITGCLHECPYCLEGSTPILLANGRTLPISALRVGDGILGTRLENGYRRVVETKVLAHWRTVEEAVRITLEDGRQFVCSGNHRWLTPRGWKYTLDGQITRGEHGRLIGQRPHLTTNDPLFWFGTSEQTPAETDAYRRGYLSGVIRGDGHLKHHRDQRRENSFYWSFRLAMKDGEAVARAKRYLQSFGVETQDFAFAMVSGGVPAIRTSSRASFETISNLIAWSDTPEYYRGLLAGLFDAEGHGSAGGKTFRIYNGDPDILAYCEKALAHWGFQSVYDTDKVSRTGHRTVRTVRITGGVSEHIRFFQVCDPAVNRKLALVGAAIKSAQSSRVASIEPLGVALEMFDITTETSDFIANGAISHNCYARDIANRFYPERFAPTFRPARLGAPAQQRVPAQAATDLGYRNIFTCSMADLFGKWVPQDWIEAVLDVIRANPQWNFLFLTKFPTRLAEFAFPPNAWLGTSVDCQARVKHAERSFARARGGVKWLSIEPMLEPITFTSLEMFDWVVIGGASASTQTPEWHPPRRWVDDLEADARAAGCMIYEKTNLQARPREYPGWERDEPTLPDALAYLPSINQELQEHE